MDLFINMIASLNQDLLSPQNDVVMFEVTL